VEIAFAEQYVILAINVDLITFLSGKENSIVDSYGSYVRTHRYHSSPRQSPGYLCGGGNENASSRPAFPIVVNDNQYAVEKDRDVFQGARDCHTRLTLPSRNAIIFDKTR
jgi:hypothetical protein